MKEKIVAIVVLMLVATTVVSATNGLNVKENNQPKTCGVNVPIWKVGDSWTGTLHETRYYYYYSNHTRWYTFYNNCTMTETVTAVSATNYTMKWTSTKNEGRTTIGTYRIKFTPFTKFSGGDVVRKTDLAMLSQTAQKKGLAIWLMGGSGFPMPVQYLHEYKWVFKEPWIWLPFPMNASTSGTFPGYGFSVQEKCTLDWGLIKLIGGPVTNYSASPVNYKVEMANVTVPAGTYNAYNVSVDYSYGAGHYHHWEYYAPQVGETVKYYIYSDADNFGNPGTIFTWDLVSTTYTP